MQKPVIIPGGLLVISLITFNCSVIAQDSLSNFEDALKKTSWSVQRTSAGELIFRPPTQTQTSTDSSVFASSNDMEKLARELEASGWVVKRETDGNLILIPATAPSETSSKTADSGTDAVETGEITTVSAEIQAENVTAVSVGEQQWQQFQQTLQQAGWFTEVEADGSLRLEPPQTVASPQQKAAKSRHKLTPESKSSSNKDNSFLTKQQQLELQESGWLVTKNQDGSVLLYPPEKTDPGIDAGKSPACPGTVTGIKLSLPVNTWKEAHDIAKDWLNNQAVTNAVVGKIRKILDIYLVSIVSDTAPHSLKQQIAIRNSDGAVIVLN